MTDGKTHRWPVCWQEEYKHNEHANTPKGDKLLGTVSRVHDEPRHQQAQNSQNEKPESTVETCAHSHLIICSSKEKSTQNKNLSLTIWSIYRSAWRFWQQVWMPCWLFRPSAHSQLRRTQRQRPHMLGPQVQGPSGNPVHRLQWSMPHNLQSTRESVSSKNVSWNPFTYWSWIINKVSRWHLRDRQQFIVTVEHTLTDA